MGNFYQWRYGLVCLVFLSLASPVSAFKQVETKSIAQLTFDDGGEPLYYPASVFFDPVQEDVYVVNGGNGRIVVYGPDYFPRWSIGAGRQVAAPRGGTVLPDGRVFAVQISNKANPTPKITVLNGAFFPELEIPLNDIPAVENFIPRNVALNGGLMYVAGDLYRGILVLDEEGFFLRKLQPTDKVSALSQTYEAGEEQSEAGMSEDVVEEFANIPEEFRPRQTRGSRIGGATESNEVGPVKVNYVTVDSKGRLYMISPETGKIYVHDAEERFLFSFGTKGGSPGQLSHPRAMAIDEEQGFIYVVDYMRHSILAYTMDGRYLFETGGRGENPGWFNYPNDIAITSRGEIIVADLFNKRVQILEVEYQDRFLNLEEIIKSPPGAKVEPESSPEVEAKSLKLVPGMPDVDYEQLSEEMVQAIEAAESADEGAPDEKVEIEVLQDQELPVIPDEAQPETER